MGQHFAEILGVCIVFGAISGVDKPQRKAQHVAIGIHLGAPLQFRASDTNENLEHKRQQGWALFTFADITPYLRESPIKSKTRDRDEPQQSLPR